MIKRNLSWLRQHTNVEDLLDDGIENNSDLKSFAKAPDPVSDHDAAEEGPLRQSNSSSAHHEAERPLEGPQNKVSYFGAVIGASITIGGILLVLFPVDMFVFHDRTKYYRPFWEHVTHGRSEIYGVAGILLGAVVFCFSVYQPRE
jgi:hypothetical protein